MDELYQTLILLLRFKTLFPLFVFDISKQSERLKYSVTDIHVKATFTANPH